MSVLPFADEVLPKVHLGELLSLSHLCDSEDEEKTSWVVISVIERSHIEGYDTTLLFDHLVISVEDSTESNLSQHFALTNALIKSALELKKDVLVHCASGISRSCTVVCAYLMKEYSLSSEQAMDLIREKRPIVGPNSSFRRQLNEYELVVKPSSRKNQV